jgi:diaminopropionate ammonia-lyase
MVSIEVFFNKRTEYNNDAGLLSDFSKAYDFHASMPGYQNPPLHALNALASQVGVKGIYVKDESYRFGLNAFKGLGVSFALHTLINQHPQKKNTFVACTDGNHGRALAWYANRLGHEAMIFMPKGSEGRRVKAIEQYQAQVMLTDMNYDDTVRYAAEFAERNHFHFVQDTALPGYTDIPKDIILGYSTMIEEVLFQLPEKPTHIFLQAGVGSLAGGVLWYLYNKYQDDLPFFGVIEASSVACIYESVRLDQNIRIGGEPYTVMAGLNCGEANFLTFPLLKAKADCFIKCEDEITFKGMHRAKNPVGNDVSFNSGESGAVGLGLIEEIISNSSYKSIKEKMQIHKDSVVLIFNTEGEIKDE